MAQLPIYRAGNIVVTQTKSVTSTLEETENIFLQLLADSGVEEIRKLLKSGMLQHPTGALDQSIRGRVEGNAVVWWSDVAYAGAVEYGVRPHQMWHLLNRTVPLTLWKSGSEFKIFRRVTLKSLLAGKWFNPGYPGKFVFQRGVTTTIEKIPELLAQARQLTVQILS